MIDQWPHRGRPQAQDKQGKHLEISYHLAPSDGAQLRAREIKR
jgi:hypothetical protein